MLEDLTLRGVFLSDKPLDANECAGGNHLLEVSLPEDCCDSPITNWWRKANRTVNGVFPQRSSTDMVMICS